MMVEFIKNSVKELKQCLAHSKCSVSIRPLYLSLASFPAETLRQPKPNCLWIPDVYSSSSLFCVFKLDMPFAQNELTPPDD